jgi:hypothetical protein
MNFVIAPAPFPVRKVVNFVSARFDALAATRTPLVTGRIPATGGPRLQSKTAKN